MENRKPVSTLILALLATTAIGTAAVTPADAFIPTVDGQPLIGPAIAEGIIHTGGGPSNKCLVMKQAGSVIGTVCGDWTLEQFKFDSNGGDVTAELQPPCPTALGVSICFNIGPGFSVYPDNPPLPPGTPQFTPDVKARFQHYSDTTKYMAAAVTVASAIARASGLLGLNRGLGALAAVLGRLSQDQNDVANDPSDLNYNVAVTATLPPMPDLSTAPACAQKLAQYVARWTALAEAAHTAYNRTYTAAAFGDTAWTQAQARATLDFANQLDVEMQDVATLLQAPMPNVAQRLLLCNDTQQPTIDPGAIAGILQTAFADGYPDWLLQPFAAMGVPASTDPRTYLFNLTSADPRPVALAYNALFGTKTLPDRVANWNQLLSWTPDYLQ